MKIFSAEQTREADRYTIANEPVLSLQLMERASRQFVHLFTQKYNAEHPVYVFCGRGNNGGDGLAIARMLLQMGYTVEAFVLAGNKALSEDAQANYERLHSMNADALHILESADAFPDMERHGIIIDAIAGTGLAGALHGLPAAVVQKMNAAQATIVSVDVPSGLYTDGPNAADDVIVKAHHTYTFQFPKLSFLLCQNSGYTGRWQVLDIGLSEEYIKNTPSAYHLYTHADAQAMLQPRGRCGHKGTYGHALFMGGAYGKMGAALLGSRACLRAGAGLLTAYIPRDGYTIFQTAFPEAMVLTDRSRKKLAHLPDIDAYDAIAFGPGAGKSARTQDVVLDLLRLVDCPLVMDADGLNILAESQQLLHLLPRNVVLTPHPKEFERLAGPATDDWQRLQMAIAFAQEYHCVLVLKSAYTSVHLPDGSTWFNSTGNPGMATGGAGDVLTGIITGLLAQGYAPADAARLGVYLHGLAGDIAAENRSQWAMLAGDIIEHLGDAFLEVAE